MATKTLKEGAIDGWHYLTYLAFGRSLAEVRARCISSSRRKVAGVQSNAQVNLRQIGSLFERYHWPQAPITVEDLGSLSMMKCNPFMGSLHSFIRHASQWRKLSPRLEALWSGLPVEVKTLVGKVEGSSLTEEAFFVALVERNLGSRMFSL